MNYAETEEDRAARSGISRKRRVVAVLTALCAMLAIVCGAFIAANMVSQGSLESMSDKYIAPDADDGSDAAAGVAAEPDWDGIEDEAGTPASMWVRVPSKEVDFPVAQWGDNEYGLHHDIYGNWSWAGVFVDCDADPDRRNVIVYGHTLYGGGMFTPLSRTARDASEFSSVGTLSYATPSGGWRDLEPAFAIDATPSFTEVRRFSFEPGRGAVEAAAGEMLAQRAASGKWNFEVAEDGDIPESSMSVQVSPRRWYVLTDAEVAECAELAEAEELRSWLSSMLEHASQASPDAQSRISSAEQCVILGCCSWPFNGHRTLLFFLA